MILSQQGMVLEGGGRGGCDSFTGIEVWGGGGEGGEGGSNVILFARGFVGITSCSVGNCIEASCLVVASNLFFSMHCPHMLLEPINSSVTILFTYFFDIPLPFNISCCN